jgi:hypothetical protein
MKGGPTLSPSAAHLSPLSVTLHLFISLGKHIDDCNSVRLKRSGKVWIWFQVVIVTNWREQSMILWVETWREVEKLDFDTKEVELLKHISLETSHLSRDLSSFSVVYLSDLLPC